MSKYQLMWKKGILVNNLLFPSRICPVLGPDPDQQAEERVDPDRLLDGHVELVEQLFKVLQRRVLDKEQEDQGAAEPGWASLSQSGGEERLQHRVLSR